MGGEGYGQGVAAVEVAGGVQGLVDVGDEVDEEAKGDLRGGEGFGGERGLCRGGGVGGAWLAGMLADGVGGSEAGGVLDCGLSRHVSTANYHDSRDEKE